jgi:hypothetical protein
VTASSRCATSDPLLEGTDLCRPLPERLQRQAARADSAGTGAVRRKTSLSWTGWYKRAISHSTPDARRAALDRDVLGSRRIVDREVEEQANWLGPTILIFSEAAVFRNGMDTETACNLYKGSPPLLQHGRVRCWPGILLQGLFELVRLTHTISPVGAFGIPGESPSQQRCWSSWDGKWCRSLPGWLLGPSYVAGSASDSRSPARSGRAPSGSRFSWPDMPTTSPAARAL